MLMYATWTVLQLARCLHEIKTGACFFAHFLNLTFPSLDFSFIFPSSVFLFFSIFSYIGVPHLHLRYHLVLLLVVFYFHFSTTFASVAYRLSTIITIIQTEYSHNSLSLYFTILIFSKLY